MLCTTFISFVRVFIRVSQLGLGLGFIVYYSLPPPSIYCWAAFPRCLTSSPWGLRLIVFPVRRRRPQGIVGGRHCRPRECTALPPSHCLSVLSSPQTSPFGCFVWHFHDASEGRRGVTLDFGSILVNCVPVSGTGTCIGVWGLIACEELWRFEL